MTNLLIILSLALVIAFWLYNTRVRESAYRAALKTCAESNVQNLDGYVALKKVYFGKNPEGKRCLLRRYQFEFSTTGSKRYLGHIVMQGRWPIIVEMEASE